MTLHPLQDSAKPADPALRNSLPKVPAHLVSLAGESVVRMRVDAGGTGRIASGAFATVDLEALRATAAMGVTPAD